MRQGSSFKAKRSHKPRLNEGDRVTVHDGWHDGDWIIARTGEYSVWVVPGEGNPRWATCLKGSGLTEVKVSKNSVVKKDAVRRDFKAKVRWDMERAMWDWECPVCNLKKKFTNQRAEKMGEFAQKHQRECKQLVYADAIAKGWFIR